VFPSESVTPRAQIIRSVSAALWGMRGGVRCVQDYGYM
jgi:hypothetical protein